MRRRIDVRGLPGKLIDPKPASGQELLTTTLVHWRTQTTSSLNPTLTLGAVPSSLSTGPLSRSLFTALARLPGPLRAVYLR